MEKESTGLQKEAKAYLDAMRSEYLSVPWGKLLTLPAMSSAQGRIAETVALFYTADKTSDVRALGRCGGAALLTQHREQWPAMRTRALWTSSTTSSSAIW